MERSCINRNFKTQKCGERRNWNRSIRIQLLNLIEIVSPNYTHRGENILVFIKIILSAQLLLLPKDRGQLFRRHMSRSPQLSYIVRAKFERNSTSRNINASFSNFPLFQFQLALIFVSFRTMQ